MCCPDEAATLDVKLLNYHLDCVEGPSADATDGFTGRSVQPTTLSEPSCSWFDTSDVGRLLASWSATETTDIDGWVDTTDATLGADQENNILLYQSNRIDRLAVHMRLTVFSCELCKV